MSLRKLKSVENLKISLSDIRELTSEQAKEEGDEIHIKI